MNSASISSVDWGTRVTNRAPLVRSSARRSTAMLRPSTAITIEGFSAWIERTTGKASRSGLSTSSRTRSKSPREDSKSAWAATEIKRTSTLPPLSAAKPSYTEVLSCASSLRKRSRWGTNIAEGRKLGRAGSGCHVNHAARIRETHFFGHPPGNANQKLPLGRPTSPPPAPSAITGTDTLRFRPPADGKRGRNRCLPVQCSLKTRSLRNSPGLSASTRTALADFGGTLVSAL